MGQESVGARSVDRTGGLGGRLAVAVGFVVVVTAPYFADALGWDGTWGVPVFVAMLAAFPLTGYLVGRWWVVPLLLMPPVVLWPLGQDPEDSDLWHYAWELIWGPMLIGAPALIAGYAVKQAVRWGRGEFGLR